MKKSLWILGFIFSLVIGVFVYQQQDPTEITQLKKPMAPTAKVKSPILSPKLPAPRLKQNRGTASREAIASTTGDPKLDEVYRTDPKWAKRWDAYKVKFIRAQAMRRQPPAPPEPPWIDEERFRISQPPNEGSPF